jgi:uncharacterized Zn finger protein
MGWDRGWRPYVPVAERRRLAMQKVEKMKKKGQTVAPVAIAGRTIAGTFWGKAWCENLEAYSDYANRLPRGRTYVRNGSVIDLQIRSGRVEAMVSGSDLYRVNIEITPLMLQAWNAIKSQCAGRISSLLDLLSGKLSQSVMEIVTHRRTGLFPSPGEIAFKCSCPDWAYVCKHVAAVLYGVGARLDHAPELLFQLRNVNHGDLITHPAVVKAVVSTGGRGKVIAADELGDIFGIDIESEATPLSPAKRPVGRPRSSNKAVKKEVEKAVAPVKRAVGRPRSADKTGDKKTEKAMASVKRAVGRPSVDVKKAAATPEKKKKTAKGRKKAPATQKTAPPLKAKQAEPPAKRPVGRPKGSVNKVKKKTRAKP